MESQTKKLLVFLILPLALLTTVVLIANDQARPDFRLRAHFYGFAALLQTYSGHNVIIDGGPDDQILSSIGRDLPFFDRQIDMLILTKVDSAHVSGLVDVLKRYSVKTVLVPESSSSLSSYWEFLNLVDAKHIKKTFMEAGQRVWLDQATVLDIYNPNPFSAKLTFGKTEIDFPNDNSGNLISDGNGVVKN